MLHNKYYSIALILVIKERDVTYCTGWEARARGFWIATNYNDKTTERECHATGVIFLHDYPFSLLGFVLTSLVPEYSHIYELP